MTNDEAELEAKIDLTLSRDPKWICDRREGFRTIFGLCSKDHPRIIETGTMRNPDFGADGGSTYLYSLFAKIHSGFLFSVDIHQGNVEFSRGFTKAFDRWRTIHLGDSIEFLHAVDFPVDLLYLDSLDTYLSGYEEHGWKEFLAVETNLIPTSVVALDDTSQQPDGSFTGKGINVAPRLIERGWKLRYCGRQCVFTRDPE